MIPLVSKLTQAALRIYTNKTRSNLTRRLGRLKNRTDDAAGRLAIENIEERLDAIDNLPTNTIRERRTKALEMGKLNQLQVTRSRTFDKSKRRIATDQLEKKMLLDPMEISRMGSEESELLAGRLQNRLRRERDKVIEATGQENVATMKIKKVLEKPVSQLNTNERKGLIGTFRRSRSWDGLTPEGAETQQRRGVKFFGDDYTNLTTEQQSALWDAVNRTMEFYDVDSVRAISLVKYTAESDRIEEGYYTFFRMSDGKLMAEIGRSQEEADFKAEAAQFVRETMTKGSGIGPLEIYGEHLIDVDDNSIRARL